MAQSTNAHEHSAPFHFCRLAVEIQINILEYTSLISPTSRYTWNTKDGFGLDPLDEPQEDWHSPGPLFLVNKSFYEKAREIFWKNNVIEPYLDSSEMFKPWKPGAPSVYPTRYAATQFFSEIIAPTTLPYLTRLEFGSLALVQEEVREKARGEWLETFKFVRDMGLRNLSHVKMSCGWYDDDEPRWETVQRATTEEVFELLKRFIRDHMWPFWESGRPAEIAEALAFEVRCSSVQFRYMVHKRGREVPAFLQTRKSWGSPRNVNANMGNEEMAIAEDNQIDRWQEELWLTRLTEC